MINYLIVKHEETILTISLILPGDEKMRKEQRLVTRALAMMGHLSEPLHDLLDKITQ